MFRHNLHYLQFDENNQNSATFIGYIDTLAQHVINVTYKYNAILIFSLN